MQMTTGAEMTTAVIDLITGIILIPLCILVAKTKGDREMRRRWLGLLSLLSAADIMGFVAHHIEWKEIVFDVIWIFLYAMMFGIVREFLLLAVYEKYGSEAVRSHFFCILNAVTAVMYVITTVRGFFLENFQVLFVVYAAIVDLPALIIFALLAIKEKRRGLVIMSSAIIPQMIGLCFQITQKGSFTLVYEFDCDGIYHICLLVSVIIFTLAAIFEIRDSNGEAEKWQITEQEE